MVDSQATMNMLSKRDFDGLKWIPQLTETSAKVYPYMSDKPLNLCGKFQATLTAETFYVAKDDIMSVKSH